MAALLKALLAKLEAEGLALPEAAEAKGNYVPYVIAGTLVSVSGSLPIVEGELAFTGKVGKEQTVESAYLAARHCLLNALSHLRVASADFENLARIVHLDGFVNSVDGFADSPKVINGASDLLVHLFGDRGRHSRVAVSVNGLPLNASVETRLLAELKRN